ncbi:hypothetical protein JK182_08600, partial [Acetobacter okinawensis]|nr:hypothetical protein [Acetobacter okinawensis]
PLASLNSGLGEVLGACGGQRGFVSGSFFHVLATVPERVDAAIPTP